VNVGDFVERYCSLHGDKVAVLDEDGATFTFRDLDERSNQLANALIGLGLERGDRVALLVGNRIEWFDTTYGLAKAGFVRNYVNPRVAGPELTYQLVDSGSRVLIVAPEFADLAASADLGPVEHLIQIGDGYDELLASGSTTRPNVPAEMTDLVGLSYSSGTTGNPKGVLQTHENVMGFTNAFLFDFDFAEEDVLLHLGPMSHAAGGFSYPMLYRGGRQVLMRKFSVDALLAAIPAYGVTTLMMVPTMIYMVLDEIKDRDIDVSSIRNIVYGTAPIAPHRLEEGLKIFGSVFQQSFGMTEAGCVSAMRKEHHRVDAARLSAAGRPGLLSEVRLVDADGNDVGQGEVGEIVVRGPFVAPGYWNRPEETAARLRDGWLFTTDMGRFDDEGFLHVVDRKNEMIISGGFNVYPREVENILVAHPAISEAAVFGIPDERWGEKVHASVVTATSERITAEELDAWCRERLSGYKVPRSYALGNEELPKGPTGKLLRRVLREPFWKDLDRRVN
jgi:acyl-CoA synthetase (AMP-forming)/AMP-acid ligase II